MGKPEPALQGQVSCNSAVAGMAVGQNRFGRRHSVRACAGGGRSVVRLIVTVALLALGAITGGVGGFACMSIVIAVMGIVWPPRKSARAQEMQDAQYNEITPARRGREADPTRPDDFKGMKEYRREKR